MSLFTTRRANRIACLSVAFAALLLVGGGTTGCGGSGGSSNQQTQVSAAQTRAETIRAVRETRTLPGLLTTVETGLTAAGRKINFPTRQTSAAQYNATLGLYYTVTQGTLSYTINFFTDEAATQGAGNIVITPSSTTSAIARFNVTGGNYPLTGALNLQTGSSASLHTTGTLRLTKTGQTITPDVTTDANGQTTGTLTSVDSSGTLRYRSLVVQSSGQLQSNLEFSNITGSVTQQSDGSGQALLGEGVNRYQAMYDANGAGTLTRLDGSTTGQKETIADFDVL